MCTQQDNRTTNFSSLTVCRQAISIRILFFYNLPIRFVFGHTSHDVLIFIMFMTLTCRAGF